MVQPDFNVETLQKRLERAVGNPSDPKYGVADDLVSILRSIDIDAHSREDSRVARLPGGGLTQKSSEWVEVTNPDASDRQAIDILANILETDVKEQHNDNLRVYTYTN